MFDNWINESNIKCFDINEFRNGREIGDGNLGKAYYANKNLGTRSYILKSININDIVVEELINDVIMFNIYYGLFNKIIIFLIKKIYLARNKT
jgi:hypothetical protein